MPVFTSKVTDQWYYLSEQAKKVCMTPTNPRRPSILITERGGRWEDRIVRAKNCGQTGGAETTKMLLSEVAVKPHLSEAVLIRFTCSSSEAGSKEATMGGGGGDRGWG